jgi:hypothetical protein
VLRRALAPLAHALAALGAYQHHVLRIAVTLYRIRHTPARHDFGTRYTRDDLPADVQETLAELSFVAGLDDLAAKLPRAERLLRGSSTSRASIHQPRVGDDGTDCGIARDIV